MAFNSQQQLNQKSVPAAQPAPVPEKSAPVGGGSKIVHLQLVTDIRHGKVGRTNSLYVGRDDLPKLVIGPATSKGIELHGDIEGFVPWANIAFVEYA